MENKEVIYVSIEDIIPNRFQPRVNFNEKDLNELSSSIKQHGILQPLLLRRISDKYEIIAGERRYKAACIAGLNNVPAIIVNADDNKSAEIAITENIQRRDLSPIEEAASFKKLLDAGGTQESVATKLGISQSSVANKLRLLSLSKEAQDALLNNKISERHARGLLRINDHDIQIELLNKIMDEKLTVKQTDEEINKILSMPVDEIEQIESNFHVEIPSFNPSIDEEVHQDNNTYFPSSDIIEVNEEETSEFSPFQDKEEDKVEILDDEFEEAKAKNNVNYGKIISKTRDFTKSLEDEGYNITAEEFDFENMYQIVIKIKKTNS